MLTICNCDAYISYFYDCHDSRAKILYTNPCVIFNMAKTAFKTLTVGFISLS